MQPAKPTGVCCRTLHRFSFLCLLFLALLFNTANAQTTNAWTWMSGYNAGNQPGVYGTRGVENAANKPGQRDSHTAVRDAAGNVWLFGGWTKTGEQYNDLWKYNPLTNRWTWMSGSNAINQRGVYGSKGVAAAANMPGGRFGHACWIDASNNVWIFGGYGLANSTSNTGNLNDLWMYNTTTRLWTWISGNTTIDAPTIFGAKGVANASNVPGGRTYAAHWMDAAGNLWLHGGGNTDVTGASGSYYNDLWKFDQTTKIWTWISGTSNTNTAGLYGTRGTAAASNYPGSRSAHSGWKDANGDFWLWGGRGYSTSSALSFLNDLWKYNPATNRWTWVNGFSTGNGVATYGVKGTAAATNLPGARWGQAVVVDATGKFWLFGGNGLAVNNTTPGALNDLWMYHPITSRWTWVSGDNAVNAAGTYGTKEVAAVANKPGARIKTIAWVDATGYLWIHGGFNTNVNYVYNDLWRFSSLTVLPDKQVTLRGSQQNNNNLLGWETIGEVNTKEFIVERSANGTDYTTLSSVISIGAGNHRYTYTDRSAATTTYFYRIRVVEHNGQTYYSALVTLHAAAATYISAYPNPARNSITLELHDQTLLNTAARLYTTTGQLVGTVLVKSLKQIVDLQRYPKGMLTVHFQNGKTLMVVKE